MNSKNSKHFFSGPLNHLLMNDNSHNNVYFPETYDIISFILQNDIPIEFREVNEKPSVIDIISLMLQVVVVRIFSQLFSISNPSNKIEEFMVKLLNSDFNNSIQYLYNFGKNLTPEDIKIILRNVNCTMYINKRQLRRIIKNIS